jgi:hypothetical protein
VSVSFVDLSGFYKMPVGAGVGSRNASMIDLGERSEAEVFETFILGCGRNIKAQLMPCRYVVMIGLFVYLSYAEWSNCFHDLPSNR